MLIEKFNKVLKFNRACPMMVSCPIKFNAYIYTGYRIPFGAKLLGYRPRKYINGFAFIAADWLLLEPAIFRAMFNKRELSDLTICRYFPYIEDRLVTILE